MLPKSQPRKKRNSSKVNLAISAAFHTVLLGALFYFAAREGLLGKKIQKISVEMIKEKQPEKPKEKPKEPEKPKVDTLKAEQPKAEPPKFVQETRPVAPSVVAPPVVAPPSAEIPSFTFEGGKEVTSVSDPVQLYKGYMEFELRSKWNRPDNLEDAAFIAEVEGNVARDGALAGVVWRKGSGNDRWDQSVKEVFKLVRQIDRRPTTNFPPMVTIRFDVQQDTEPVMMQ